MSLHSETSLKSPYHFSVCVCVIYTWYKFSLPLFEEHLCFKVINRVEGGGSNITEHSPRAWHWACHWALLRAFHVLSNSSPILISISYINKQNSEERTGEWVRFQAPNSTNSSLCPCSPGRDSQCLPLLFIKLPSSTATCVEEMLLRFKGHLPLILFPLQGPWSTPLCFPLCTQTCLISSHLKSI